LGQDRRGPGEASGGGLILIKAYDDTFSQTVLVRHSYRHDEIVWGNRFAPAFFVDGAGDLVLELRKVGELAVVAYCRLAGGTIPFMRAYTTIWP